MQSKYQTEQEMFWAGEFGVEYIGRNKSKELVATNIKFFADILSATKDVHSILELGANIGLNLRAIKMVKPEAELAAVEINEKAAKELDLLGLSQIYVESILNFKSEKKYDFVFTKTVLIHINPEALSAVYDTLYAASNKYICLAEYYNPQPVVIDYRGHQNKLFKRDFCGELMDRFPELKLIDYGFLYHRDNNFLGGDITWFLLEKK